MLVWSLLYSVMESRVAAVVIVGDDALVIIENEERKAAVVVDLLMPYDRNLEELVLKVPV